QRCSTGRGSGARRRASVYGKLNLTATRPSRARPACTLERNGFVMLLPAPCARITAGVRPGRRKPGGSATTADTAPPPGNAIRRRRLARFIGGRGAGGAIAFVGGGGR